MIVSAEENGLRVIRPATGHVIQKIEGYNFHEESIVCGF